MKSRPASNFPEKNPLQGFSASARSLLNSLKVATWFRDAQAEHFFFNETLRTRMGLPNEEFEHAQWKTFVAPYDLAEVGDKWKQAIIQKSAFAARFRLKTNQGYHWVLVEESPWTNESETLVGWIGTITDLQERKELEELLRSANENTQLMKERFAAAELAAQVGVWDWNLLSNGTYCSPYYLTMLGYSKEEIPDTNIAFDALMHPEDRDSTWEAVRAAQEGSTPHYEAQFRLKHKDGKYRWILSRGRVIKSEDGTTLRMVGAHIDVTRQRKDEEALRASENRLNYALSVGQMVGWEWNPFTDEFIQSANAESVLGRKTPSREAFLELVHPADRPSLQEHIQKALKGSAYCCDYRIIRSDTGEIRWIEDRAAIKCDELGQVNSLAGVFTDITRRKQIEIALRENENKLVDLMNATPSVAFMKDRQGRHLFANRKMLEIFEVTEEEVMGKKVEEFLPLDVARALSHHDSKVLDGGVVYTEQNVPHRDGLHTYLAVKFPVFCPEGTVHRICGIATDITDQKRAQIQLQMLTIELERSNRDLEHFAWAASHDLKEPIRNVSIYMSLLARRFHPSLDEDARNLVELAIGSASRMASLVDSLLAYARLGAEPLCTEEIDPSAVFDEVVDALTPAIEETSAIITKDPLPPVYADRLQLSRVFQNLLSNAIKFRKPSVPPQIHLTAQVKKGQTIFSLTDNGIGVAPEYHERIFEVFKRLHPKDQFPGHGIGLAACKKIIERHGGRIWVACKGDTGSSFCFSISNPPLHNAN